MLFFACSISASLKPDSHAVNANASTITAVPSRIPIPSPPRFTPSLHCSQFTPSCRGLVERSLLPRHPSAQCPLWVESGPWVLASRANYNASQALRRSKQSPSLRLELPHILHQPLHALDRHRVVDRGAHAADGAVAFELHHAARFRAFKNSPSSLESARVNGMFMRERSDFL